MPGSVIVGGARTPIGKLAGSLKGFTAMDLGGFAIKSALERAGVAGDQVDYVIMGHVIQAGAGQITARQAAVKGGIPMSVPALTINKVCLSGLNAIAMADQLIGYGEFDIVVAGGMEFKTNGPYLQPGPAGDTGTPCTSSCPVSTCNGRPTRAVPPNGSRSSFTSGGPPLSRSSSLTPIWRQGRWWGSSKATRLIHTRRPPTRTRRVILAPGSQTRRTQRGTTTIPNQAPLRTPVRTDFEHESPSMNTRWQGSNAPRGDDYDARWRSLAAQGQSIHGEADLVSAAMSARRRRASGCRPRR